MRFLALIIITVFLFTGCGVTPPTADITQGSTEERKMPRIPSHNELKASVLDVDTEDLETDDMEELLEEIDKELNRPNISEEDIKRGWYYGSEEDKKYGTPDSWVWVEDSDESRWVSPNVLEDADTIEDKDLCDQTAGTYVISCLDTEVSNCEYASKSECHCTDISKWYDQQGCILTDEEGGFVSITQDDLRQGWYIGLPNEKKLDTPSNWLWVEGGQDSRWQNPSPK
jgi:hypothetical protein